MSKDRELHSQMPMVSGLAFTIASILADGSTPAPSPKLFATPPPQLRPAAPAKTNSTPAISAFSATTEQSADTPIELHIQRFQSLNQKPLLSQVPLPRRPEGAREKSKAIFNRILPPGRGFLAANPNARPGPFSRENP